MRRVYSDRVYQRIDGPVLQAVCDYDCDFNGDFGHQLADAFTSALRSAAEKPSRSERFLSRTMDKVLGWFFRPFNRAFAWAGLKYANGVGSVIRKSAVAIIFYVGLVVLRAGVSTRCPRASCPPRISNTWWPLPSCPTASLDRTEAVMRKMADIGMKTPGIQDAVQFPGLSISGFSVSPNSGIIFFGLKPFEERTTPELSGMAIAGALNQGFSGIQEAFVLAVPPPPVMGLGAIGGFKLFVEDRGDLGYDQLNQNLQNLMSKGQQTPGLGGLFSTFTVNVPQLDADIDRVKAKTQGVPLQNLFETMQIYLGSLYVNDFNRFGRTYQVIAQADSDFRNRPEHITGLKTRNRRAKWFRWALLVKVKESYGPDRAVRYNGYPAAEINGGPRPGFSSGQAEATMANLANETLPKGMAFEWTELTYQRILAGNTAVYVYPLCMLLVFLVLAAQYESFRLPLAIILIVPMCLLFAIAGVWLKGGDNNIFTQIGLIVLVGLACKNAILIVEFAKHKQDEGMSPRRRHRSLPLAVAPDSDDVDCVYRGRVSAGEIAWRGCRDAPGHGRCCVLRHDRCDAVRIVPHPGFLLRADEDRLEKETCPSASARAGTGNGDGEVSRCRFRDRHPDH